MNQIWLNAVKASAVSAPPPGGWWLDCGIPANEITAVYQPKSAASLAASYVNLANPGTHDATVGAAPNWSAAEGWQFNGVSHILQTGIVPLIGTASMVILYSDATPATNNARIAGVATQFNRNFAIAPHAVFSGTIRMQLWNGAATTFNYVGAAEGVAAIGGMVGYLDGSAVGALTAGAGPTSGTIAIGAANTTNWGGMPHKIQAMLICADYALSAAQVLAVTQEMQAL